MCVCLFQGFGIYGNDISNVTYLHTCGYVYIHFYFFFFLLIVTQKGNSKDCENSTQLSPLFAAHIRSTLKTGAPILLALNFKNLILRT